MSARALLHRLERSSLNRQYTLVFALVLGVLLATALTCSATVVWASTQTRDAGERVIDLEVANRDVLQDMTEARSEVRGYVLGERRASALQRYDNAILHLHDDMKRLRDLARGDAALAAATERQERANLEWARMYASSRLEGTPGDARGDELFDDVRSANSVVADRIQAVTAQLRAQSRLVLLAALAVVVLLPLVLCVLVAVVVHRAGRAVVLPLTRISAVLEQLRHGDVEARAQVSGPEEIRQIAQALNSLTDENLRASEVEADVLNQLESIDRVRTDLVSTVSHELRTPLTSISGYLELLEDDLGSRLDGDQAAMMAAIRRNLDRLNELITNLLALSRAEETRLALEPVDLRAVVTEVTADVRLQAAARDISVRTSQPPIGVVVAGDRSQLIRAVQNLVTNAVKFSRPGGIVAVRVREQHGEALVEIEDEGIGIPAVDLDRLGSRFFRGSNAMKAEIPGTGLGLRIVQTILDRHDGLLSVESVEGEGATFSVRLPLAGGTASAERPPTVDAEGASVG